MSVWMSREVATAIHEAMILDRLSIASVSMWWGYWGNKIGKPHTVPCKVTSHCGLWRLASSLFPEALTLSQPQCPRSHWWWLVLMGATPQPGTAQSCRATSPMPLLMPFPRLRALPPLTSAKRLCSPSLPTRSWLTILKRPHQTLHAEDPGSSCGWSFIQEK